MSRRTSVRDENNKLEIAERAVVGGGALIFFASPAVDAPLAACRNASERLDLFTTELFLTTAATNGFVAHHRTAFHTDIGKSGISGEKRRVQSKPPIDKYPSRAANNGMSAMPAKIVLVQEVTSLIQSESPATPTYPDNLVVSVAINDRALWVELMADVTPLASGQTAIAQGALRLEISFGRIDVHRPMRADPRTQREQATRDLIEDLPEPDK